MTKKERIRARDFSGLTALVGFLNYNFDAKGEDRRKQGPPPFVAQIQFELNLLGETERNLQKEITQDLSPFITPGVEPCRTADFELNKYKNCPDCGSKNAKPCNFTPSRLSALVQKISKLNIKPEWIVVSGSQYLYPEEHLPREQWPRGYDPLHPQRKYRTPNPAYRQLGPGHRILKAKGAKWFIAKLPWYRGNSPREVFYEIIFAALQDGSFFRLRMCPQCKKMHLRRKFCSTNCYKLNDRRDAPERMKKLRRHSQRAIKAGGLPMLSRLVKLIRGTNTRFIREGLLDLDQIPELSMFREQLRELWEDFMPRVLKIKDGRASSGMIWTGLPSRIKEALSEAYILHGKVDPNVRVARRPRRAKGA